MKKRIFTQEEIDTVIYNYTILKMGQKKAGLQFHMNDRLVKRLLIENNVPIKTIQETNASRYKINENFFDEQNSDVAYILGLIASDGCVASNENCIYIELQDSDAELLEEINKKLGNEREVKHYVTKRNYKNCKLYFYSKKIKDKLREYNIIPNKTYSSDFNFPFILKKKYWIDYIRGYFDGDGCIKKTGVSLTFQLDSVKKELLETVQRFFKSQYDISTTITYSQKSSGLKVWRLYCYSTSAQKIFELMYANPSCLRLKRKYEKFLQYKK